MGVKKIMLVKLHFVIECSRKSQTQVMRFWPSTRLIRLSLCVCMSTKFSNYWIEGHYALKGDQSGSQPGDRQIENTNFDNSIHCPDLSETAWSASFTEAQVLQSDAHQIDFTLLDASRRKQFSGGFLFNSPNPLLTIGLGDEYFPSWDRSKERCRNGGACQKSAVYTIRCPLPQLTLFLGAMVFLIDIGWVTWTP